MKDERERPGKVDGSIFFTVAELENVRVQEMSCLIDDWTSRFGLWGEEGNFERLYTCETKDITCSVGRFSDNAAAISNGFFGIFVS